MSDLLTERLNQILPKVISDAFLSGSGIGNEIAFYIFDYPPEHELRVREHIRFLLDHMPSARRYVFRLRSTENVLTSFGAED